MDIKDLKNDKIVLEGKLTQLVVDFIQKYPDVSIEVNTTISECHSVGSGVVSKCVSTDIKVTV